MDENAGPISGSTHNLWVLVRPAEDLEGQWCAHVLELDVVSYGESLLQAFQMAQEAAAMVIEDDVRSGLDFMKRRAPDEYWNELYRVLQNGEWFPIAELLAKPEQEQAQLCIAAQIVVHAPALAEATRKAVPKQPLAAREPIDVPIAWRQRLPNCGGLLHA